MGTFSKLKETKRPGKDVCLAPYQWKTVFVHVRCLRVHSAQRVDWMSVEAAMPAALGELRAARLPMTVLLWRERRRTHEEKILN